MSTKVEQSKGFFELIKEYISGVISQFKNSPHALLTTVLCFGVGYIFGFILKRYFNYVVFLILCIFGIMLLKHFQLISLSLNTHKIEELTGITSVPAGSDFFTVLWSWIKQNSFMVISFVLGTILGLKVA